MHRPTDVALPHGSAAATYGKCSKSENDSLALVSFSKILISFVLQKEKRTVLLPECAESLIVVDVSRTQSSYHGSARVTP